MADIVNTVIDKKAYEQVDQLAKKLEMARLELVELIGTAQGGGNSFRNIQLPKDLDSHLKKIATQREKITEVTEKERIAELNLQTAREKAFDEFEKRLKKERSAREKQVKSESDLRQRLAKQKEAEYKKEISLANKKAREDVKQAENQKILGRNAREMAKLSSRLTTAYEKQSIVLERLRRKYKDVALTQGENSAEARKMQKEIQQLDQKLKRVDANVGQFQRNVGNYSKAWRSLGGVLRSTASAFGIMGGAMMFAGIIKNGIARIREFDKEMQNLAGIVGVTRGEVEGLEQTIIDVAGASIKTSNEVAKLATSLISLGKTPAEVKLLLKPVNDLAIALQATSDEAGELLVQTLNAFGKGAESGDEFANIIAKVRSSTALDFRRISDSLSYVSATGSALGLTLEEVAAILGTLNDSGIKAARAGRLMNSTFGRLNQRGISLNEALEAINNSTDKVATATDLFGTQSFSLGLILADNTEKTKKYAESFGDAGGALDSLVNEQLKSLDANIKILDSAWERFVLTFDNGSGVISKALKSILSGLTAVIDTVSMLNDDGTLQAQKVYNDVLKQQADYYKELGDEAEEYAKIDQQRAEESLARSERDLKALEAINEQLRANAEDIGFGRAASQIKKNEKRMEELRITTGRYRAQLQAANNVLDEGTEVISGNTEEQEKNNEAVEESKVILEGSVAAYNKIISELKDKRDRLSQTREEYERYNKQISEAEENVRKLTEAQKELVKYMGEGTETGSFGNENDINAFQQHLRDNAKEEVDIEEEKQEEILFLRKLGLERAIDLSDEQLSAVKDIMDLELDLHREFEKAKRDVVFESIAAIGEARIKSVEDEIDANRRKYSEILANEALSEEQRSAMEARRDAEEVRLEEKRKKREKEAFLIKQGLAVAEIAINLARTISAINLAAAGLAASIPGPVGVALAAAYTASNLPIAIGTAAAQTGIVLAQTIPQFKHGHMSGTHEGIAEVGDGYRPEVITDKDGNVKQVTPARPTLTYLDRGDKVFPSVKAYEKTLDYDSILRASLLTSIANQSERLTSNDLGSVFDRKLADIDRKISEGIKDGFRNINIHTTNKNDNAALLRELTRQRRRDV